MKEHKLITIRLKPEEVRELKLILPRAIEAHLRQESLARTLDMDQWERLFRERRRICDMLITRIGG